MSTMLGEITVTNAPLYELTHKGWVAIATNNDPPQIFVRGDELVYVAANDESARLVPYDRFSLSELMSETAIWTKQLKHDIAIIHPPERVANVILGWRSEKYVGAPRLDRVTRTPFFALEQGASLFDEKHRAHLVTEEGYSAEARAYYAPDPIYENMPTVDGDEVDLTQAVELIDGMLTDFPFAGPASRAHAWSLLLLPFVRELINGDTPMYLITAPTAGTGKGLLTDTLLMPAVGKVPRQAPTAGDEWEKRITASLLEGPPVILIDNVPPPPHPGLDSPALATVLTSSGLWEGRVLGSSQMVRLPVRNVWVATGNNIDVSNENSRRICRIHLDRETEDPTQGNRFRIPNLHSWVQRHRMEVTWAALTIVQAWLNADHPEGFDSYEGVFRPLQGAQMKQSYIEWSRVMGGILRFVGIEGFLSDAEFIDATEREELDMFFEAWDQHLGGKPWKRDEVAEAILMPGSPMKKELPVELIGIRDDSMRKELGYWLRKNNNRVSGGRKLVKVPGRPNRWAIKQLG